MSDQYDAGEVQGAEQQLPFHTMGWLQFQRLCETVLVEELGQTVQSWEPGQDGGRDAAFFGTWTPRGHDSYSGAFVFQVKYSRDPRGSLTLSLLRDDINKARALHASGDCDHYVVISNVRILGEASRILEANLREQIGCSSVVIFGNAWLTGRIIASARLRTLVPRVYGLGDLGEIIDTRGYEQFRAILKSLSVRLRTFVPTRATADARAALNRYRFVLLVGDPMTGKSTTAAVLALTAMDDLGFRVLKIRTADEFIRHWNANRNTKQFFWIDDAFGETTYDRVLTREWGKVLDAVRAAIETTNTIVFMTSRSYIWSSAKSDLKTYEFPALNTNRVDIKLDEFSLDQKQEILYNHVRLGDQSPNYKAKLRDHLAAASGVATFLPEVARRLGRRFFTASRLAYPTREAVVNFFERPTEVIIDIIEGLDSGSKSVLAVLFANGGRLEQPVTLTPTDISIINLFGSDVPSFMRALRDLDETLIRLSSDFEGHSQYVFVHPTIRDALAQITGEEPQWLDIYLAGSDRASILRETSAGRSDAYGVKLIIPAKRFAPFADWLIEQWSSPEGKYDVSYYLATHCGESFLKFALCTKAELFKPAHFSYGEGSSSDDELLPVVARLQEYGILPNYLRDECLSRMRQYATLSLDFLEDLGTAAILTRTERLEILSIAKAGAKDRLSGTITHLRSTYSPEVGTVESYFHLFYQYAYQLLTLFSSDTDMVKFIEESLSVANDVVAELRPRYYESGDGYFADVEECRSEQDQTKRNEVEGRDIFVDVADPL